MADVDDGEEAGAKDSGPAIMSRGGQHGDVHHLDSFLRGTDDWHQPLGAESYETEDEGEETREGSAEADMDAEEAELSGGAPSTPDKTPPHNTCIFTFTFTIHQMKLLSFTFTFTIHLLEILREFRSLYPGENYQVSLTSCTVGTRGRNRISDYRVQRGNILLQYRTWPGIY